MKKLYLMRSMLSTAIACSTFALCLNAQASSHREAPFITSLPKVDATDFYMFRSYESGRDGYVTFIANYQPLQDAYGGPNYFALDPDALYEIHVDNDGDAVEDITFQFSFNNTLANGGNGLTVPALGQDVAVPLKFIGGVTSSDNSALNFNESYQVTMVTGDRRTGQKTTAINTSAGSSSTFSKPLDNVGDKTFGSQVYADYANTFIQNMEFPGCPASANDGRVFVGQREESFAVNLGEIFDLVNTNPLGAENGEANILAGKNITSLVIEVPIACLTDSTATTPDVIGAWTTASVRQVQVIDPTPEKLNAKLNAGAWTQVSRLGMPLVNEVVIGLPDKNRFNASEPKDDAQFASYVTNPTLPVLLNVLFGVTPPTNDGRADLVAAFLTGLSGANANGSVAEMQRLNTAVAPTAKASQDRGGFAYGDSAGFPNGRRPGDDVVDIELRVAMGALCHLGLGLCDPADAPSGDPATFPYTDGALQDPSQFGEVFPYLNTPLPGASSL